MDSILKFLLYNPLFEYILIIIAGINMIFLNKFDVRNTKKDINKRSKNLIERVKIIILFISCCLLTVLFFYFFKNFFITFLFIVVPFVALCFSIYSVFKNKNNFSLDDNYNNISGTFIFYLFFSSFSIPLYFNTFSNMEHFNKEILLLIFIILKIVLFFFLLIMNFFVLLNNIHLSLKTKKKKKKKIFNLKYYKLKFYDFYLYKTFNSKFTFIIDFILYFILCIPSILLNIILILSLKFIIIICNAYKHFRNFAKNIDRSKNYLIQKTTSISIIFALISAYIIIILNKNLFSNEIKEIYEHISTVIIIPLLFDFIKQKNEP